MQPLLQSAVLPRRLVQSPPRRRHGAARRDSSTVPRETLWGREPFLCADCCSPPPPGLVQSGPPLPRTGAVRDFGRDIFSSARRDCSPLRQSATLVSRRGEKTSTLIPNRCRYLRLGSLFWGGQFSKDRVSVRPGRKTIIMWVNWEGLVFRLRRGMRGRLNRNLGGRGGECGACLTVTWEVGEENAGPA